jgi:hypothetical protein
MKRKSCCWIGFGFDFGLIALCGEMFDEMGLIEAAAEVVEVVSVALAGVMTVVVVVGVAEVIGIVDTAAGGVD